MPGGRVRLCFHIGIRRNAKWIIKKNTNTRIGWYGRLKSVRWWCWLALEVLCQQIGWREFSLYCAFWTTRHDKQASWFLYRVYFCVFQLRREVFILEHVKIRNIFKYSGFCSSRLLKGYVIVFSLAIKLTFSHVNCWRQQRRRHRCAGIERKTNICAISEKINQQK